MTKAEINADWRYNTGYIVLYNKKYIILVENLVLKKEICYDRGSITKIDMNTKIKLLVILACSLGLVANVEAGWYGDHWEYTSNSNCSTDDGLATTNHDFYGPLDSDILGAPQ
jgi:hypothetical protein